MYIAAAEDIPHSGHNCVGMQNALNLNRGCFLLDLLDGLKSLLVDIMYLNLHLNQVVISL